MNNYDTSSLKNDLEKAYVNIKSTDNLHKLEDFMINAIEKDNKRNL